MSIDFYYMPMSAPCRSILMTARAVGASLNLKPTNPMGGETRTEEFLKVYDVTDALTSESMKNILNKNCIPESVSS
jgi:hypothetical protein